MSRLRIAADLTLPADEAVTQTFAVLAKRGSGKSFLARRLAEQLHHAGQQIVILDPKGDTWGIRSSADGKHPGLPIVIVGGEHADVPLEATAGELVAKLVVEERVSLLVDLSLLRKGDVGRFCAEFLETLYRLKAREAYRTPLMLIVDEADAIAPQKVLDKQGGYAFRMLGAIEDIVRRGRQRGIGCTLVTQRSAVLNKNVLTQTQILVALRTTSPQDLAAMGEWVGAHGTPEQHAQVKATLPSLPTGDAWFWSPGWPTAAGIFQRVHVLPIETFDSGATPRPGERRVEPKHLADVDLDALRRRMAETIERAKANDPAELRRRVAQLERELAAAKAAAPKRVEGSVFTEDDRAAFLRLADDLRARAEAFREACTAVGAALAAALARNAGPAAAVPRALSPTATTLPPPREAREAAAPAAGGMPTGERAILTACAQRPDGETREGLTVLTGYKRSSRDTYVQRLRQAGHLEVLGDRLVATAAGRAALGPDFRPLPTGDALLEHWRGRLPEGERRVLDVCVAAHPAPVARDRIDDATGYKRSSRDTYLQRLMARRLVETAGPGMVRAAAVLFEG